MFDKLKNLLHDDSTVYIPAPRPGDIVGMLSRPNPDQCPKCGHKGKRDANLLKRWLKFQEKHVCEACGHEWTVIYEIPPIGQI